jgi:disulfide bond formation protein DsbB
MMRLLSKFEDIGALRLTLMLGLASVALLAGAWWFELWLGLIPCKLCLEQRQPHYAALGVTLFAVLLDAVFGKQDNPALKVRASALLGMCALFIIATLYAWSTWLGLYHSGVEWGWFAGPNDCGGTPSTAAPSPQDFLKQLQSVRVVSCTEAAWRLAGLSLAGWNALFSAALALLALTGSAAAFSRLRRS